VKSVDDSRQRRMKLAKSLVFASAVIFVVVGAGFLLVPKQCADILEISLPTSMARTDVRATYGGLELGFGIFLICCVVRHEWIRPGLWALAFTVGGFAAGRLAGFVAEGTINNFMLFFLVLELAVASLAVFLLRRPKN
jgi:uncharacterized membrane protein